MFGLDSGSMAKRFGSVNSDGDFSGIVRMMAKKKINWKSLGLWVVGVEFVGITGGIITAGAIEGWYVTLEKPWFSPPNWIFGPVWTVLYAMVGISGYLIWVQKAKSVGLARKLFGFQLVLNGVWSPIFFGLQNPLLAMVVIGGLWCVLVLLIRQLWQTKRYIVWWLVPYFGWVSFASILNLAIVYLN